MYALHLFEVARLLNDCISLSHISSDQYSHHHNVQSLIQQQIQQNLIESQIYQRNGTRQQSFYPDGNIYNATSIPSNNNNNPNNDIHVVPPTSLEFIYLCQMICVYIMSHILNYINLKPRDS